MDVKDRVVFITGGASGIGKAVAGAILQKGGKVCIADISDHMGDSTSGKLGGKYGHENVIFQRCDVTDAENFEAAFQAAVEKFGHIDVMINNAGIVHEKHWKKCVAVNMVGVIEGTMLALNHMRKDMGGKGGVIISTASTAGLAPGYWLPVYAATKSAIINFTNSWAKNPDLAKGEVRLACVCPGGTDTSLLKQAEEGIVYHPESFQKVLEYESLCSTEDVAAAYIRIIEDLTCNGSILKVTARDGLREVRLTAQPVEEVPEAEHPDSK